MHRWSDIAIDSASRTLAYNDQLARLAVWYAR